MCYRRGRARRADAPSQLPKVYPTACYPWVSSWTAELSPGSRIHRLPVLHLPESRLHVWVAFLHIVATLRRTMCLVNILLQTRHHGIPVHPILQRDLCITELLKIVPSLSASVDTVIRGLSAPRPSTSQTTPQKRCYSYSTPATCYNTRTSS